MERLIIKILIEKSHGYFENFFLKLSLLWPSHNHVDIYTAACKSFFSVNSGEKITVYEPSCYSIFQIGFIYQPAFLFSSVSWLKIGFHFPGLTFWLPWVLVLRRGHSHNARKSLWMRLQNRVQLQPPPQMLYEPKAQLSRLNNLKRAVSLATSAFSLQNITKTSVPDTFI